jgi:hypothetical protein
LPLDLRKSSASPHGFFLSPRLRCRFLKYFQKIRGGIAPANWFNFSLFFFQILRYGYIHVGQIVVGEDISLLRRLPLRSYPDLINLPAGS